MIERILKLDVGGRPVAWISREEGALLYCRNQVAWEAGAEENARQHIPSARCHLFFVHLHIELTGLAGHHPRLDMEALLDQGSETRRLCG